MPHTQLHELQHLLGNGLVLETLEGVDEEDEEGDPLMHLQLAQLHCEELLEEDRDQLWVGVEAIPSWHTLPELLVQHDCHRQNVFPACLLQITDDIRVLLSTGKAALEYKD